MTFSYFGITPFITDNNNPLSMDEHLVSLKNILLSLLIVFSISYAIILSYCMYLLVSHPLSYSNSGTNKFLESSSFVFDDLNI